MKSPFAFRVIHAPLFSALVFTLALCKPALPADEKAEGLNASPTTTMGALRGLSQTSSADLPIWSKKALCSMKIRSS